MHMPTKQWWPSRPAYRPWLPAMGHLPLRGNAHSEGDAEEAEAAVEPHLLPRPRRDRGTPRPRRVAGRGSTEPRQTMRIVGLATGQEGVLLNAR